MSPAPAPRKGVRRVLGLFDSTTKVLVGVTGLILAAAGLWAALHQFLGSTPKNPEPSDAAEVTARQVQACEERHGMDKSAQTFTRTDGVPSAVRLCAWPPASYADRDGYTEITVDTVDGPGDSEATTATLVDRIKGPCKEFLVAYDFGQQGGSQKLAPFLAKPGDLLIGGEGQSYPGSSSELSFYADRTEVDVLHNYSYILFTASCRT